MAVEPTFEAIVYYQLHPKTMDKSTAMMECKVKGEGKVVPVLNLLSTAP
jgi:hypothetical protein